MPEQLPTWLNVGVEPPESLKTNGWQPGMKPSAQHMNWLFNCIYIALKELQDGGNLAEIEKILTQLKNDFTTHKAEMMPHKFSDGTKSYKYGFKTNAVKDGLIFVYEEVV